jgi:hypothetical protein
MEQKLTKRTKLNSLALTWNQGRSPSLPSRPSVQIPACSLPAARISRISGPISAGRSSQSHSVALSRTQSNQKMEQKLTKGTKLNSLALTWNQGRSPSLPSRPSVQIPACSLPAARFSRSFAPISAGRSSQSNPVALSRPQSGLPEMQGKSSQGNRVMARRRVSPHRGCDKSQFNGPNRTLSHPIAVYFFGGWPGRRMRAAPNPSTNS